MDPHRLLLAAILAAAPAAARQVRVRPCAEDRAAIERLRTCDPNLSVRRTVARATCQRHDTVSVDGPSLGTGEGGTGIGRRRVAPDGIAGRIPRNPGLCKVGAVADATDVEDGRVELAEASGHDTLHRSMPVARTGRTRLFGQMSRDVGRIAATAARLFRERSLRTVARTGLRGQRAACPAPHGIAASHAATAARRMRDLARPPRAPWLATGGVGRSGAGVAALPGASKNGAGGLGRLGPSVAVPSGFPVEP